MAAAEAEHGVFGVYFMMGPSPHNAAWFDLPYSWEAIRHIGDMGHAIGYHVDVMDTISRSTATSIPAWRRCFGNSPPRAS